MLAISYRRSRQIKYALENTANIPTVFWHRFDDFNCRNAGIQE